LRTTITSQTHKRGAEGQHTSETSRTLWLSVTPY